MFTILGSGFGLYGYLPALIAEYGLNVILPERYRNRLLGRPELNRFASSVRWVVDEEAALRRADGVVIALPPKRQSQWVGRCLSMGNVERLLLEKPLAESPDAARFMLETLLQSRRPFRVAYTFRYTYWGENLAGALRSAGGDGVFAIQWRFLAHHFRHGVVTWKRYNAEGGGAVRFYGIHLIALLAEIGYRDVATSCATGPSANEFQQWRAVFIGAGLPACEVVVDTRSPVTGFSVGRVDGPGEGERGVCANDATPFEPQARLVEVSGLDERVPLVSRLCRSLLEETAGVYDWYESTLALWSRVEAVTDFEGIAAGHGMR